MNAFMEKNEVKICEKVLNNLGQLKKYCHRVKLVIYSR